jgi:K+-sensing histidine kinase KdpD
MGLGLELFARRKNEFASLAVGTNTSRDGYGLGLSIVRRLVKLLELKLEVQSEVGADSLFALELPPGQAQATTPPPVHAARAPPFE